MIQEDRLLKILALLEARQSLSVNELKDSLYVSTATVRRDLQELSRRGLIVRSFGGAVALTSPGRRVKDDELDISESSPIALAAAELVPDESCIFIGGSPVSRTMVLPLSEKSSMCVVTDSLYISRALCGSVEHVYCTGGSFNNSLGIFTGSSAAEFAARYRYDFAFFSFDAVNELGEISDQCIEKLSVFNAVMSRCKNAVLLAPEAIIGREASAVITSLSDMDIIVTDRSDFFIKRFSGSVLGV